MHGSKAIVEELKSVLDAEDFFQKLTTGKPMPIDQEDVFPSCYLVAHTTSYEFNNKTDTSSGGYDNYLLITLHINLNTETDLEHLDIQDMVFKAVLRDSRIWTYTLDRDIEMAVWDFNDRLPKKEGQITFRFRHRMCDI